MRRKTKRSHFSMWVIANLFGFYHVPNWNKTQMTASNWSEIVYYSYLYVILNNEQCQYMAERLNVYIHICMRLKVLNARTYCTSPSLKSSVIWRMFELFEAYVCWFEWEILQNIVEIIIDFLLFLFLEKRTIELRRPWMSRHVLCVCVCDRETKRKLQITIKAFGNGTLALI